MAIEGLQTDGTMHTHNGSVEHTRLSLAELSSLKIVQAFSKLVEVVEKNYTGWHNTDHQYLNAEGFTWKVNAKS